MSAPTMSERVKVRAEGGAWSVYLDGVRVLAEESFGVADAVADCIANPGARPTSEAREVADAIRKAHGIA